MNMTVAIATNTLGARSETFVTRHVDSLNGGRTVVVCRRIEGAPTGAKPVLMIGDRGEGLVERGRHLLRAVGNELCRGGLAIPSADVDRSIARFLREHQASSIVAEFGPIGCIMQRAAAIAQVPLYVYFRGRDATSLLRRRGVSRAYRRLFPQIAGVIAVSAFLLENLRAQGLCHHNSHVIPSGVDTDVFVPGAKDRNQLLSVGRFVPKKAPDLVIRAFAGIAPRFPVRLDMIGDGPLLESCRRLSESLGLGERVRFLGALPHDVVRERMTTAAMLLQHSITDAQGEAEGLPSVIQEGMSAGMVVISTRHAGIPEAIIPNVNGLLVDEGDLDGFADAIDLALANPELAGHWARQARADAIERFDCRILMRKLEEVIACREAQSDHRPHYP